MVFGFSGTATTYAEKWSAIANTFGATIRTS
jgi:hypothetical protein